MKSSQRGREETREFLEVNRTFFFCHLNSTLIPIYAFTYKSTYTPA